MSQDLQSIPRPGADEFAPYYGTYVDKVVEDGPILEILAGLGHELRTTMAGIDDERGGYRYAEDKWSIKEVLGHLIDAERIFSCRALCFARGEKQPLPGMDQDEFVLGGEFDERPITSLLDEHRTVRESTIALFGGLSGDQLRRRGVASGCEFTCRSVAYIIAGHERHHLGVLRQRYGL